MTDFEAALLVQFARIATALELLVAPPQTEEGPCEHPADQRWDFGITDGRPDWQCRLCNYHSVTDDRTAVSVSGGRAE